MKLLKTLLLLALFVVGAPAVLAQEKEDPAVGTPKEGKDGADGKDGAEGEDGEDAEDAEEEEESEIDKLKRMFKDIDDVIGSVTLSEADVKSHIKYAEEMEDLTEGDEEMEKLVEEKGFKEAFDSIVKDEEYVAWAAERELNAEDWMRKYLRVTTFQMRAAMATVDDATLESLEASKEMLEGLKGMMEEEEYEKAVAEIDDAIESLKGMKEFGESLPEPTESETKLLEQYASELEMP